MKYSLLILFAAIYYSCTSNKADSLEKYSYLIYKNIGGFKYSATGFFVNINEDYYLISAKHVFTGWSGISMTMDNDYPDTLYVSLCEKCNPENQSLDPIIISEIKKRDKHLTISKQPDFYIYKVKKDKKLKLNCINDFMPDYSKIDVDSVDSVFMYGFPEGNGYFDISGNVIRNVPLLATGTIDFPLKESLSWDSINKDQFHYMVKADVNSRFGEGYSGAPVFFMMNGRPVFWGICAAGSHKFASFLMVKPNYVLDSIKALTKQPF